MSDYEGHGHGSRNGSFTPPRRSRRTRSRSRSSSYRKRNSRSRSRSYRGSGRYYGSRKPSPCRCLGIFGLSLYTQTRQLRDVFSKYGNIDEITIVTDAQTGRSRGFAFVYYDTIDEAEKAKEACNGIDIDGRQIRVDFSITKRPHTPTPGIYMGKPSQSDRYSRRPRYNNRRYDDRRDSYRDDYRHSPSPYYSRRSYRRSRSRSCSPDYYGGTGNFQPDTRGNITQHSVCRLTTPYSIQSTQPLQLH